MMNSSESVQTEAGNEMTKGEAFASIVGVLIFFYLTYRGISWFLKPAATGAAIPPSLPSVQNAGISVIDIMEMLEH